MPYSNEGTVNIVWTYAIDKKKWEWSKINKDGVKEIQSV